jgi:hypothetical protein
LLTVGNNEMLFRFEEGLWKNCSEKCWKKCEQNGQGQVFQFWDGLNDGERFSLCHQTLRTCDVQHTVKDVKLWTIVSLESHTRGIWGFGQCTSLHRIEIPSSVEVIESTAFFLCPSLRVVVIHAGCRMRRNGRLRAIRPFIVYEEDDMKASRSLFHLGVGGKRWTRRWPL